MSTNNFWNQVLAVSSNQNLVIGHLRPVISNQNLDIKLKKNHLINELQHLSVCHAYIYIVSLITI